MKDIQIDPNVHNKLIELCSDKVLNEFLLKDLDASKSEIPDGMEKITCNFKYNASTSSGSAVIAEENRTSALTIGQRKLAGFEMEIYSVYEAARLATNRPAFFAAKAVVDDGGANKGDQFHRIGCLLSAKFIVKAIQAGIVDVGVGQRK